ncbi:hypothetical protein [Streptomyces griseochromogenes]|uniref:hypothetical protein n=1 Tax=Streptomyces griseochromogenes TaxID=68214 RepID=UPI0037B46855
MPPHLRETLAAIGAYEGPDSYDGFLAALGGSPARLTVLVRRAEVALDVSDLDAGQLRDALRTAVADVGQDVWAAWPDMRTAVRVAYRAVLERLDDLWYPGSDDLVIIDGDERVLVLDHEERLFLTRADAKLRIHSVEERDAQAATCIVRCVGGVVRVGQRFGVGSADDTKGGGTEGGSPLIALAWILRYERPVDFVDPPHSAKVRLTGEGVGLLEKGIVITAVVDTLPH